jgi:hypothetical protein
VRALSRSPGVRSLPPGVPWSDRDLQSFSHYQVTAAGREEADRVHRLRRESATDAALGARLPILDHAWLNETQRGALADQLRELQTALDRGRHVAAIGAAKNLVEAASKVVLEHTGEPEPPRTASPSALFKLALTAIASRHAGAEGDLGRSLTTTVHRLGELRNEVGAGHGTAAAPDVDAVHARLAAAAGASAADFLLSCVAAE